MNVYGGSTGTSKIFEAGAFGIEFSRTGALHGGWGDNTSANDLNLANGNGFPWTEFGNELNIGTVEDNSITSDSFGSGARLVTKTVDLALGFENRFAGLNRLFAWMFGFEGTMQEVVVARVATPLATAPAVGTVMTCEGKNYKFLRAEEYKDMEFTLHIIYILEATDGVAPTAETGTFEGGAIDIPFTYCSDVMYEHTYELSYDRRGLRDFETKEVTSVNKNGALFIAAGDQRSLFATLAKRFSSYGVRYANALCQKLAFNWKSADMNTISSGFLAFRREVEKAS